MSTSNSASPKAMFGQLNVIYYALLAGQFLFAVIIYFVIRHESIVNEKMQGSMYLYIGAAAMLVAIVAQYFYDKNYHIPGPSVPLDEKVGSYKNLKLVQWSFLEAAVLLNLIFFLVSDKLAFLAIGFVGMIIFTILRPSLKTFASRYRLIQEEKQALIAG